MQQTAVQPDQQPYVDNIRWSGRRMKRLVEDMLTLSRADDGRLKAAMVPVDLSDAVVDTALRLTLDSRTRPESILRLWTAMTG